MSVLVQDGNRGIAATHLSGLALSKCFKPINLQFEKNMHTRPKRSLVSAVFSNHLENIGQTGNRLQIGLKIEHVWKHHPVFGALWILSMGANQEKAEPRSVNHGISVSVGLLGSCWLGVSWTKSLCFMKFDPFLVQTATIGLALGFLLVLTDSCRYGNSKWSQEIMNKRWDLLVTLTGTSSTLIQGKHQQFPGTEKNCTLSRTFTFSMTSESSAELGQLNFNRAPLTFASQSLEVSCWSCIEITNRDWLPHATLVETR